jgi:hypothetical protein
MKAFVVSLAETSTGAISFEGKPLLGGVRLPVITISPKRSEHSSTLMSILILPSLVVAEPFNLSSDANHFMLLDPVCRKLHRALMGAGSTWVTALAFSSPFLTAS